MKADQIALQRAIRTCWDKMGAEPGVKNKWNITGPAEIRQELAYATTTTNYQFQFAANAGPVPSTTLNNVQLGENDIFWMGAVQILYGSGANSNNRAYYSRGFTPSDDALYNGTLDVAIESTNPVISLPMQWFREEGDTPSLAGIVVLPMVRRLTGKFSNIMFTINLGKTAVNISGLTLTANGFISVAPIGVLARP